MTTPPMFAAPPSSALTLSAHFAAQRAMPGTISNHGLKGHVACEECVWTLHEAKGKGEPPRSATRRWSLKGQRRVLLCSGHAGLWPRKKAR